MSKSIIYAGNNATQTTTADGTVIAFNNIVRRYGCNLGLSGGNVIAKGTGYYRGDVNLTFEGTATGTAVFTVYKNGVAVPYANASRSTADGVVYGLSIPFEIRNNCCCDEAITVVASGIAVDVTNSAILVEKE